MIIPITHLKLLVLANSGESSFKTGLNRATNSGNKKGNWTRQRYSEKENESFIREAENLTIKSVPNKAFLFVSRQHPDITDEQLSNYLRQRFPEVCVEEQKSWVLRIIWGSSGFTKFGRGTPILWMAAGCLCLVFFSPEGKIEA